MNIIIHEQYNLSHICTRQQGDLGREDLVAVGFQFIRSGQTTPSVILTVNRTDLPMED